MEQGRSISLSKVRADGWFERLADDSPNFVRLCDEVGSRVVAFSIIAGVRITSLTLNEMNRPQSLVEFEVGDDATLQQLPLGEFQQRVSMALLESEVASEHVGVVEDDTPTALQELIGFRYVLLAALFGLELEALVEAPEQPLQIQFRDDGSETTMFLEQFRERLQAKVREESDRRKPAPFSLDLSLVEQAQDAADAGEHEQVLMLLGAWPGPLSLLLRSAEASRLAPEVRGAFARGLGILGTAYAKNGQFDWAQEVIRLGIQWGQDSSAASELFRRLGEACMERERYGEAIGLLRRAMAIGEPRSRIVAPLAVCYADRERWLAALLCAEEALSAEHGDWADALHGIQTKGVEALGEPWRKFRESFPGTGSASAGETQARESDSPSVDDPPDAKGHAPSSD